MGAALAQAAWADGGVTVAGPAGTGLTVTAAELAKLPAVPVSVSFGTEHGKLQAAFSGPLLWTVLKAEHALPAKPSDVVRDVVVVTGSDGYSATVALGEIATAFENKSVILALQMDGKPLAPAHLRLVVPGDAKGGRSVKDVVRIAVLAPRGP